MMVRLGSPTGCYGLLRVAFNVWIMIQAAQDLFRVLGSVSDSSSIHWTMLSRS